MKSFDQKDSFFKRREASLKRNLKKRKKKTFNKKKEIMPVLSDKWIKRTAEKKV